MARRGVTGLETIARIADYVSTIDRYDLLLGLIPTAFTIAFFVGRLLDLPSEATLLGGVAVAVLALFDGLFFRPPTGLQGS